MKKFYHVILTLAFWFTVCMNGLVLLYANLIGKVLDALENAREKTRDGMNDATLDTITLMAAVSMAFFAGMVFCGWLAAGYWEAMHAITLAPVTIQ